MFCAYDRKNTNYDNDDCNDNHDGNFDDNDDKNHQINIEIMITIGIITHQGHISQVSAND